MKVGGLLLPILLPSVHAQLGPSDHYDLICPGRHGQIEMISYEYFVKYNCDAFGNNDGNRIPTQTPVDCAKLCEGTFGCKGSTWASDTSECILSGDHGSGTRQRTVYMEKVAENRFQDHSGPDPFEREDKSQGQCLEEKKECTVALGQCHTDALKISAELSECRIGAARGTTDLSKCHVNVALCTAESQKIQNDLSTAIEERDKHRSDLAICIQARETDKQNADMENPLRCELNHQSPIHLSVDGQPNRFITLGPDTSGQWANVNGKQFRVWCSRCKHTFICKTV